MPYASSFTTINRTHPLQTLVTMCASYKYNIPSPRVEAKRRRSNWLSSCCGIFDDYDPAIYHPNAYSVTDVHSVSPANAQRPAVYSPSPSIRQRHRSDWLSSCCGIFEEYDPVIHHPETYSVSPASARGAEAEEESHVSGSIWRKNIIMGGKCKMPDFSGVIIYDSAGKLVSNSKPNLLALPWK